MGLVTPGYGVDVVVPIAASTYERDRRQPPVEWDEYTQEAIMQALHDSLEDPATVAAVDIQPGYIWVRFGSTDTEQSPVGLTEQVLGVKLAFNDGREVDDAKLELRHREAYTGIYQPEGTSPEGFIGRYGADKREDADAPILTWDRAYESRDDRRPRGLRYNVIIPIKAETYEPERKIPAFEWDSWAREQFVRGLENGPHTRTGGLNVLEAAVYRSHVCLTVGVAAGMAPHRIGLKAARVASSAITHRPMRENDDGAAYRQPSLSLSRSVWVGAADGLEGAEAFIREHALDEVDPTSEPDPEPETEPEEPARKGGVWGRLNPFGGA